MTAPNLLAKAGLKIIRNYIVLLISAVKSTFGGCQTAHVLLCNTLAPRSWFGNRVLVITRRMLLTKGLNFSNQGSTKIKR